MQKTIFLIDGENIVLRFQALCDEGRVPRAPYVHEKDVFAWRHNVFEHQNYDSLLRATYYTSAVGDDNALIGLRNRIQELSFRTLGGGCQLNGVVFKKDRHSKKSRSVDINITIDALTHCYGNHADRFCLVTGDSDFLPLIDTLMRNGKQVHLFAFSSGLSEALRQRADLFTFLDEYFFEH